MIAAAIIANSVVVVIAMNAGRIISTMSTDSQVDSHVATRPSIVVSCELAVMAEEAVLSLDSRSDIYQRGGFLVRFREDKGTKLKGLIRPKGIYFLTDWFENTILVRKHIRVHLIDTKYQLHYYFST